MVKNCASQRVPSARIFTTMA